MISNLTPSPYNQDSNIKLNKDSNINKIWEEYWINKLKTQNKIINPIVDNNYKDVGLSWIRDSQESIMNQIKILI